MLDFINSIDRYFLYMINNSFSNPLFDYLMPIITNYDKLLFFQVILLGITIYLLFFKGNHGKILLLILFITILFTDQLNSTVIKNIVARARPCHFIEGKQVVENLRLLVSCGPGYSFPSSHAANNFAMALIISLFYRKYFVPLIIFATLIAFSRVYVGVHFPSDVIAGAAIGTIVALLVYYLYNLVNKKYFSSGNK